MRTRSLFIIPLALALSGAGVQAVSASTDCDKWLREYKQLLADSQPVRKVLAVKHKRHLVRPKPPVVRSYSPVHHIRTPKLTPQEMLRRFHILCGELPPDNEMALVPEAPLGMIVPRSIEFPANVTTPFTAPLPPPVERSSAPPPVAFTPPIGFVPPGGFVPSIPRTPLVPSIPVGPPGGEELPPTSPITPVVPPVPEPSSIVLLLTGFGGVFALARKR